MVWQVRYTPSDGTVCAVEKGDGHDVAWADIWDDPASGFDMIVMGHRIPDATRVLPLYIAAEMLKAKGWTVTPPDPKPQGEGS